MKPPLLSFFLSFFLRLQLECACHLALDGGLDNARPAFMTRKKRRPGDGGGMHRLPNLKGFGNVNVLGSDKLRKCGVRWNYIVVSSIHLKCRILVVLRDIDQIYYLVRFYPTIKVLGTSSDHNSGMV